MCTLYVNNLFVGWLVVGEREGERERGDVTKGYDACVCERRMGG